MRKNSISFRDRNLSFFPLPLAIKILVSLFVGIVFVSNLAWAQKSRSQLEREKRNNMARIAETNRILKETGEKKEVSLGQLKALTEQISTHTGLIDRISEEVGLLDREIRELGQIVTAMENDLSALQNEYAAMLHAASKSSAGYNKLLFLFSSNSFTEMLMRIKYMQQYSEIRKQQLKHITTMRNILNKQRIALNQKKQEKNGLLASQVRENQNLTVLKDKQNRIVQKLSAQEQELMTELENSRRSIEKLDKLIADVIAEEARRIVDREKAAKEAIAKNTRKKDIRTPVATNTFEGAKSQLEWPVNSGFISSRFGRQSHPVLRGVIIDNHGVDIQTKQGEEVRAVYDGEVATVANIPGMHKLIIIRHGTEYMTVYAKLARVSVETGQKVKAHQVIGEVYTDKEGTSEVQFQIWRNQEKLNPEAWLENK